MSPSCAVCNKGKSCYKCPKCRSVYCSIQCNKIHKTVCPSEIQTIRIETERKIGGEKVPPLLLIEIDNSHIDANIESEVDHNQTILESNHSIPISETSPVTSSSFLEIKNPLECEMKSKSNNITIPAIPSIVNKIALTEETVEYVTVNSDQSRSAPQNVLHNLISKTDDNRLEDKKVADREKYATERITENSLNNCSSESVDIKIVAEYSSDENNFEEMSEEEKENKGEKETVEKNNSSEYTPTSSSSENVPNPLCPENVPRRIINHDKDSNDMTILSEKTIDMLLQSEYLKKMLKSSRLRDDILKIDSSLSRQSELKKIRIQKPEFNKFLDNILIDIIKPSLS